MKYTTKEENYELQRQYGIPEHSHINGLMTCAECVNLIVFGETLKESSEKMGKSFWKQVHTDENCVHILNYPDFCQICFKD